MWCVACQNEYRGSPDRPSLSEEFDARERKGLRVLGSLFQDASLEPATMSQARTWAENFDVNFSFALDDQFRMGLFANASVQPFNMLIDTSDMVIVKQIEGDAPAILWPAIDAFLAGPEEE